MDISPAIHRQWIHTGDEAVAAMVRAIDEARISVRLEMYIYHPEGPGEVVREALVCAALREVKVQVMVDSLGSDSLTDAFWEPLIRAGGQFRWFNPLRLRRVTFRNHRKLLVCDGRVAILGGFNLMPEIQGNGIERGWRDIAIQTDGPLAGELAASFDEMFALADFRHGRFALFRCPKVMSKREVNDAELLECGPGRGRNPIKTSLHSDLAQAREVRIAMAYFIPSWRMRRLLTGVVRRGGTVQLLLPAHSDVLLAQLASQRLYGGLLRSGVQVFEYQPQVLHAKLIIIDDVTYVGSANLDRRSMEINYELMLRFRNPDLASEAAQRFEEDLSRSKRVNAKEWRKSRTFWGKLKEQWAWFVIVQLDMRIARWQRKHLGRG